jgi:hypothetical protein
MLGALAVTLLVAVGAAFGMSWLAVSVTPMREPAATAKPLPTFSQVQARLGGRPDDAPATDAAAAPWEQAEKNTQLLRPLARRTALQALHQILRPSCQKRDTQSLGYYLEQRRMQESGYAASWGTAGASFIAQAWATPEDLQIVDGIRNAYERGVLMAEELRPQHREYMFRLIGPIKQRDRVCQ